MIKKQLLEYAVISGEILMIICSTAWITGWESVKYIYTIGTLLFAVGRFMIPHQSNTTVTLRRLYIQQTIGTVFALISAFLMLFYNTLNGIEIQEYVIRSTPSAWLLPFIIFVILEVYTAFRIPSELNKINYNNNK